MSRISLAEMQSQTKKVDIKYIVGAAVLFVILIVLFIAAGNIKPTVSEEEITEAAVRQEWDTTIRINEVMLSNSLYAPCTNGNFYDWIELYNSGQEQMDLSGHYLSDNPEKLDKFLIENLVLEANEYVLIYMSRLSGVDENGVLHTSFALSSLGETIYLSNDAGEIVSVLTVPEGRSNVSYGIYNDKLVWMSTPTPGSVNTGAISENLEALEYEVAGVRINEIMTGNKSIIYDCEGDYSDWVEIYNNTETTVDLSGYTMTDDSQNTDKWEFPEGTLMSPGEYIMIFCSGKDKIDAAGNIHTSFRLGKDEAEILIYSPQGRICDKRELVFIPDNVSYGFVTESDMTAYFSLPTPGKANNTPIAEFTEAQLKKMQGIYE